LRKRVGFTLSNEIYDGFRKYCKKNAFKISAKVELMMIEAMKEQNVKEQSYPTLVKMFQDMVKEQSKGKKVVSRVIEVKKDNLKKAKGSIPTIDQLRIRKGI